METILKKVLIIFFLILLIIGSNILYIKFVVNYDNLTFGKFYYVVTKLEGMLDNSYYTYSDQNKCSKSTEKDFKEYYDTRFGIYITISKPDENYSYNSVAFYKLDYLDYKIDETTQVAEKTLIELIKRIESNCKITLDKFEIYGKP